jgi:hypothetical protein
MVWCALGSGEQGTFGGAYNPVAGGNDTIAASPFGGGIGGANSFRVDPVNGDGLAEIYGFTHDFTNSLGFAPNLLLIPFIYQFDGDFDEQVSIAELIDAPGNLIRRIAQTTAEAIQLVDKDEDEIGISGAAHVAANTGYFFLWYIDLRDPDNTRDIVWTNTADTWTKIIDVRSHGDAGTVDALTFGTSAGKGLPTAGGPFWVDEMGVNVLNVSPNTTPLGSLEIRYLIPNGDSSGSDADFAAGADGGGGWGNPDSRNVDEIPHDGDTTYDEGDAAGEQQSYDIAAPGALPIAVQVLGAGKQSVFTAGNVMQKLYIKENGTRDYDNQRTIGLIYVSLNALKCFNEINGQTITEAMVNGVEVGSELVTVPAGPPASKFRLSQIGLEWMKEGIRALPTDYPGSLVIPRRPMRHLSRR